jgi:hypothetical protein
VSLRDLLPERLKAALRPVARALRGKSARRRAAITAPTGKLQPGEGPRTFVAIVGPDFDQNRPDAGMTCRLGLCRGFESLGIPYMLVDLADLAGALPSLPGPFCWISGADLGPAPKAVLGALKGKPLFVWVDPWFRDSARFFSEHGLDASRWTWPEAWRRRILDAEPRFVHFADAPSRLRFFEEWEARGVRVLPLPLACDTTLYDASAPPRPEFAGVRMAFVGGYWRSKAAWLDRLLRPFEDDLVIYGYNRWPYRGYRGALPREAEPSLYRQALVSPTVNEPHAAAFVGTNERVFKVLGSGGTTVVDPVPAYRELFTDEELCVPRDEREFAAMARALLADPELRAARSRRGLEAVLARHTYAHRARAILNELDGGA